MIWECYLRVQEDGTFAYWITKIKMFNRGGYCQKVENQLFLESFVGIYIDATTWKTTWHDLGKVKNMGSLFLDSILNKMGTLHRLFI